MSFALMGAEAHTGSTMTSAPTIALRPAAAEEAADIRRLAYLDSQRPLRGDVLVALRDAEPVAAISLADGRVAADPFRRTADVVELLRLRAASLITSRAPLDPRARRLGAQTAWR
jgi:hypothetical protein